MHHTRKRIHHHKIWYPIFAFALAVAGIFFAFSWSSNSHPKTTWGATFSKSYAEYLGLDWRAAFTMLLDDIRIREFRIPAYWTEIQPSKTSYNFSDLDWQINEAKKRDAHVLLAIGYRLPRWPECHVPPWVTELPKDQTRIAVLEMLKTIVLHYKNEPTITAWQVENEPDVTWFGTCAIERDLKFTKQEIDLVRTLDQRPIIVTDSGELSFWVNTTRLGADKVGTTMYRIVWNKYSGYFDHDYLTPAFYYRLRALLNRLPSNEIFTAELQAEPWTPNGILNSSLKEQRTSMNLEQFWKNISFAENVGFSPVYFWGAEWWLWLKEQGDNSIYESAKIVFQAQ